MDKVTETSDTRRAEAQARILEAAEQVFAEAGFKGATMQSIADHAGLPKANLHYYFGTKTELYQTLLTSILELWLEAFRHIRADAEPADALRAYIDEKMRWSQQRPRASKLFANEVIHGAKHIDDRLSGRLKALVEEKTAVVEGWVRAEKIAPLSAPHLFFSLWAMTQTYADFDVQVRAVLGRDALTQEDFDAAKSEVTALILRGCGI